MLLEGDTLTVRAHLTSFCVRKVFFIFSITRSSLLSVAHDDCCCAGRAVELECMALLRRNMNLAPVRGRPVGARDSKGHLDVAMQVVIV